VSFGIVLAGEIRRLVLRRIHAGTRPVDTIPHAVNLARPMTTTDIITHRYKIVIPEWRGPPLRITHISDLHVTPHIPESYYREVFELAERTDPDLVFATGDFVTETSGLPALKNILRPLGRLGTFAVFGNHDYWSDIDEVRKVVGASGIKVLNDESIPVVFGGEKILITGTDYPWGTKSHEIAQAEEGVLHLVLSHTPDNIYRLSRTTAHCVFSGHLHAGQFRLPWIGPLISPSLYGRRFDHGHFIVHDTHLFVVSGVGAADPPFRIYCQPDIFVIEITGETSSEH
jgi:predicted MPP superfamily phosphohydrolase